MRSRQMSLSLIVLLLLILAAGSAGCCTPPSVDFEEASKAVKGWVGDCLEGKTSKARQYWTDVLPDLGDRECKFLHSLREKEDEKTLIDIELVSAEDLFSLGCTKQLWVVLRRKDDGRKGGFFVTVANAASPTSSKHVVLYHLTYIVGCPQRAGPQEEYIDACFWWPLSLETTPTPQTR